MDQKPPRSVAEVWRLLHMANDKLEYFQQRHNALEEDVKSLAKELRAVEKSCDSKIDMISKQVTDIRITLAKWMGIAMVLGIVLQALTVAIITNYFKTVTYERIPQTSVQK